GRRSPVIVTDGTYWGATRGAYGKRTRNVVPCHQRRTGHWFAKGPLLDIRGTRVTPGDREGVGPGQDAGRSWMPRRWLNVATGPFAGNAASVPRQDPCRSGGDRQSEDEARGHERVGDPQVDALWRELTLLPERADGDQQVERVQERVELGVVAPLLDGRIVP